jgi:GT2 family glycosyltransferase
LEISIIVVNWNTRRLLLDCVESIVSNRPSRSFEIVVVDNGSTDGSPDAVAAAFPHVRCIRTGENLGFAKANNIGIRASRGRYVCFVNSDVKVLGACFDILCGFLDGEPSAGIVGPKILWPDRTLQDSCRQFPSLWNNFCIAVGLDKLFPRSGIFSGEHMIYFPHDRVREVDSLVGCFLLIRRESLERAGAFDEDYFIYSEEVDLCRRVRKHGWKIVFIPHAEAIHYGRGTSSSAPLRFFLEQKWSVLQYWDKHHGPLSLLTYALISLGNHLIRLASSVIRYLLRSPIRENVRQRISTDLQCMRLTLGFLAGRKKSDYIKESLSDG